MVEENIVLLGSEFIFYLLMVLAQNLEISYNRVSVIPRNFQLILTLIIQDFVSPVLYQAST
jgi:hypothetical protein